MDRLKSAADWAEVHARHGQEVYVHNYKLRSRDKHFNEGDTVIVLNDEASGKFSKRWEGPATVLRVKSPYSYMVDMGDGRVRHVTNCASLMHVCKVVMLFATVVMILAVC